MPESLLDARDALKHTDSLVDETLARYEERRVVDVQLFLEDFVRRELMWHARALEILSPLVGKVRGVDAKAAMDDFFRKVEDVKTTEKVRSSQSRSDEFRIRVFVIWVSTCRSPLPTPKQFLTPSIQPPMRLAALVIG